MSKLSIFIPVYYSEEEVARCLMRLTELNLTGINITLHICINGIRSLFEDTFLKDYVSRYNKSSVQTANNTSQSSVGNIIVCTDDLTFSPLGLINDTIQEDDSIEYISILEPSYCLESEDIFIKLISLFTDNSEISGISTDSNSHNVRGDLIRKNVNDMSIVNSIRGEGFSNGFLLTNRDSWSKNGGFRTRDYIDDFSKKSIRSGSLFGYVEGIR